jgi:DNA-binding winged helix-turn-helix (wHTH) protein
MNRQMYAFGPFLLDACQRVLLRDGKPVPLTPKAVDTLLVLVRNAGHLVAKDDLMKEVWPDAFVEEVNLAKNIFVLRHTLGNGEQGQNYIETVPKRGYRFVASVRARVGREDGDRTEVVCGRATPTEEIVENVGVVFSAAAEAPSIVGSLSATATAALAAGRSPDSCTTSIEGLDAELFRFSFHPSRYGGHLGDC